MIARQGPVNTPFLLCALRLTASIYCGGKSFVTSCASLRSLLNKNSLSKNRREERESINSLFQIFVMLAYL
jgi:hypothetical protein